MRIIKLNAIDSTNTYLKKMGVAGVADDGLTVVAKFQTNGRGQMGTTWNSQEAKNLTFSVFKDVSFVDVAQHFYISMAVSLAVYEGLNSLSVKKIKVKWPNDILSDNKKIAGILIENVIKHNVITASVIGIGLNVNQTDFSDLPSASSLLLLSGKVYDLDEVLSSILKQIEIYFDYLKNRQFKLLKSTYESHLFRKNKPSTFKNAEGSVFSGYITGISDVGQLMVKVEDNFIKSFDFKEVSLMY
ncbi:BirA family biotin operon repressor/biotin-[acetyl-CoA-carboxylase] ligase [Gelidibacter algens]|uniref:BirA family biotin operon repressor/biotin-[acetyl-CoA-carboxylase] ligase n=1 Tax=Gelidibacter algens TaxID=49280 RepID=A0A1A7QTV5_9FLAO|nr:biotin--[acetyl-CoA-carboxylase] ligase [Gelidibacter algens]OBX22748.1 biotin--[acetyl-CoA-carboxylase] ligase [Gelidibacter algens]RAJ20790.1 BirA family biotin operon repressor/biotin-[acetyl-CoA-carboxylase] ligase [Gelidibacter algens]